MVRPRVADGGDNVHIWKRAANILKKQLLTADKDSITVQIYKKADKTD
jgi:uncharacterized protein YaaW (UPF0174 family)